MKVLNVDFVPLQIPMTRRLETVGVLFFMFTFFCGFGVLGLSFLLTCLFSTFFWVPLAYAIFYYFDKETPRKGGRLIKSGRYMKIYKYYANYFPLNVIKTAELDPNRNYLFCASPHGIVCFGLFGNLVTEGTHFSEKFPGITTRVCTLDVQFQIPGHRECLMSNGMISASAKSLKYVLNNEGPNKEKGQAPVLVVGGAAESLEVKVGTYRLVLKNRRGFVRIALQTGAPLVPVLSFGENDSYTTYVPDETSAFHHFQLKAKKLMSFALPVFYGRGIFNYSFGFMPWRRPINTVIGAPIEVPHILEPTKEEIIHWHEIYLKHLTDLFNDHKEKYLEDKSTVLEII
jgi:2-acylglycerol O-acyltransferase 2